MTQQRVLKPYVRDRMAPHTGEPWTEAMLVGLAGGIGFMYFIFEYKGLHPTMTIIARHHPEPYLPAALARAGVPFTAPQTTSAKKATAALRAALDGGATPICTVSRDSLPWHGVRGPLYSQDPYPVAVIGVEGDTVYLDDERVTPIPVAEDAFVAAWWAYRKGKHSMITVSTSTVDIAAASTVDVSDIGGAVTDAVATTCAYLTGPVLGNTFDVNFGFSGARKLRRAAPRSEGPGGLVAAVRESGGLLLRVAPPPRLPGVHDRQALLLAGGPDVAERAAAVHRRAEALAAEFAAADPLDAAGRRALLDQLADGVESAVALEQRTVDVLT